MKVWRKISALAVCATMTLGIISPAYADFVQPDNISGDSQVVKVVETSQHIIDANDKVVHTEKKDYDKGTARENRDKSTPKKIYSGFHINPRGWHQGGISPNYEYVCYSATGSYLHRGSCWGDPEGSYTSTYIDSWTVNYPGFYSDLADKVNATRVVKENSKPGDPGVSCPASHTSTVNGIEKITTFRSMSYEVKTHKIDYANMHNTYVSRTFSSHSDAQYSYSSSWQELNRKYKQFAENTIRLHNDGYKHKNEEAGTKRLIGCYYDRKLQASATTWFGSARCVVDYTATVSNKRTGKQIATKSDALPYKKNPTVDTCKGGLHARVNVDDMIPNEFGVFRYKRTFTHDNPKIVFDAKTGWKLENPLTNLTKQTKTLYVRNTCNPSWNGVFPTPPSDIVQKGGKPYRLTFTEQDCQGLDDGLSCVVADRGNQSPSVLIGENRLYIDAKNLFSDDGTITLNRDGEPRRLAMTVPNIGVSSGYSSKVGGEIPRGLSVSSTGMAKNKEGTPWNSNAQARRGLSDNTAHLADFVMRGKSSPEWISRISQDSQLNNIAGGDYYSYNLGGGLVSDVELGSRWESEEGKPTVIRSDFTIKGEFPYVKTRIDALGPNGVKEQSGTTVAFAPSTIRCVSGPTEVYTVRPVS